ncbi:hypothetical protein JB92DRAFT_2826219 [Gautieria morchelliformis]|nr:hypothetical protein JB92DRAFT_2826219 [Gautieria morchelliformis]
MTRTYGSVLNLPMADPIYQSSDKHMKCSFIIGLSRAPGHLLHINLFTARVNYGSSPARISRSIDDVFDIETNHNRFPHHSTRTLGPLMISEGTILGTTLCSAVCSAPGTRHTVPPVPSSSMRWDVTLSAPIATGILPGCLQLPANIEEVGNTADGNGDDDSEGHSEE